MTANVVQLMIDDVQSMACSGWRRQRAANKGRGAGYRGGDAGVDGGAEGSHVTIENDRILVPTSILREKTIKGYFPQRQGYFPRREGNIPQKAQDNCTGDCSI